MDLTGQLKIVPDSNPKALRDNRVLEHPHETFASTFFTIPAAKENVERIKVAIKDLQDEAELWEARAAEADRILPPDPEPEPEPKPEPK